MKYHTPKQLRRNAINAMKSVVRAMERGGMPTLTITRCPRLVEVRDNGSPVRMYATGITDITIHLELSSAPPKTHKAKLKNQKWCEADYNGED